LTQRVWRHKILRDHPEFRERELDYPREIRKTIRDPDYVVIGWVEELLALRYCDIAPDRPKYLCVIYRETNGEGFVITTFFISKPQKLLRRGVVWSKPK
jgi:hypothetical protein